MGSYALARFSDVITDPIIGITSDKSVTRSQKTVAVRRRDPIDGHDLFDIGAS